MAAARTPHLRPPRPTAWLWFLSVLFPLLGYGIIWVLRQRLPDPAVARQVNLTIALTCVASGLCVISALAARSPRR